MPLCKLTEMSPLADLVEVRRWLVVTHTRFKFFADFSILARLLKSGLGSKRSSKKMVVVIDKHRI